MTTEVRTPRITVWMDRGDQVNLVKAVLEARLRGLVAEGEQAVIDKAKAAEIDEIRGEVRHLTRAIGDIDAGIVDDHWVSNPDPSMRSNVAMRLDLTGQSAFVLDVLIDARRDQEDDFLDMADELFEGVEAETARECRAAIHHLTRAISKIVNGTVSVTFGKEEGTF